MSYGLSTDPFLLKEGELYIGTYSSYPVSTTADPSDVFTGEKIGYFKQGTVNISMPRVYAEARSGTPSKLLRKDLTQKDLTMEAEFFQVNSDLLELLFGTDYYHNVIDGLHNHYLGSDEPEQSVNGYLLIGTLTDGTPFKMGIWTGKITSEDNALALSGTDYATLKMKVDAFVPSSTPPVDTANLGFIQLGTP